MIYIGIDPGQSGGICWLQEESPGHGATKMPATMRDIWTVICEVNAMGECVAMIEHVHAMPKQGVSSTFKFGHGAGALEMALTAAMIPFEKVRPHAWQKALGLSFRGQHLSTTERKNRHKAKAQQLFPTFKITHATADALLIAEYCRRTREPAHV